MPTFFTGGAAGRVVQLADDHTQGTLRFVDIKFPDQITFTAHKSIITRLTVAHQCNYQFLHTVGNEIYIYVFGDRIGQVTISGMSFTEACCGPTNPFSGNGHGFEEIMKWYEAHRVAAQQQPIEVMIGQTGIQGFVVGLSGDVVDPATRLMQFGLTIMVLPKKGN